MGMAIADDEALAEGAAVDEHQLRVLREHVGWLEQLAASSYLRGRPRQLPDWEIGAWAVAARQMFD